MSDSDFEYDDIESGSSSVLLAVPGKEISQGEISVLKSHIGGMPVWFQNTPPPQELLECKVCQKKLDLLAQLFCPLPDKDLYDRVLYVFACADPNCRRKEGSVRAIRGIESNDEVRERIENELQEDNAEINKIDVAPPTANLGDLLFGTSTLQPPVIKSAGAAATNASTNASTSTTSKSSAKEEEDYKELPSTKKRLRPLKKFNYTFVSGRYDCHSLIVEDEYFDKRVVASKNTKMDLKNVEIDETTSEETGDAAADSADSANLEAARVLNDPAFSHFVEVVEYNPDQVLRYEHGLEPLFYSSQDNVPAELKQATQKGNRVLEIQLMPQLISALETDEMMLDGMEWGSIFVATGKDDALPPLNEHGVGYSEEWVGVQWEQDLPSANAK